MDNVINLAKMWNVLRNNFGKIIVLGLTFGVITFGISKFVIPVKYASTASLLVNQNKDSNTTVQFADQQADVQMINTYKDIITRPIILDEVVQNLTKNQRTLVSKATADEYSTLRDGTEILASKGKPAVYDTEIAKYPNMGLTSSGLAKMITIQNQANSQVFTVSVTSTNAKFSRDAVNEVVNVFKNKIANIMIIKNVSVISKATTIGTPVSPNFKLLTIAGVVAGALIGFLWGIIRELTDRSVKNLETITDEFGLTNLGVVQYIGELKPLAEVIKEQQKGQPDDLTNKRDKGGTSRLGRRI